MSRRCHGHRSWLALLATLVTLLPPAATLAGTRPITLEGERRRRLDLREHLEGELPDGGCDRVLVASPRATVEAWRGGRPLRRRRAAAGGRQRGAGDLPAGEADRSVSEPQHWRVRLRDAPKAWIRIVPAEDGDRVERRRQRACPGARRRQSSLTNGAASRQSATVEDGGRAALGDTPVAATSCPAHPGIDGEYQITLRVTDALGRSDESTAAIPGRERRSPRRRVAEERPAWLDSAVVYGVVPFSSAARLR